MNKLLSFSLLFLVVFVNTISAQNYCTQAEPLNINPQGSCSSTSISLGADFDDQDDNTGDQNITLTTSCTYPGAGANVYWGSFVGNGNAVTIKLFNPSNDATLIVFENTPCGGNMNDFACLDVVSDGAGGLVINTINGTNYTIAIYRQSGSSSMTGDLSIVDNPSNTAYYAPCDPCVNTAPQTINVHSASVDCFSGFTQMDVPASGLQIDNGNPIPVDGCGTDDDWDWATFTASETTTNLFVYGQSSDNIPILITEGPCSAAMTTMICDDTGDKDLGASFVLNTTPGETYHVFIRDNGRSTRVCAFNDDSEPDKPFCSGGLSFEDGSGAGWSGFNGSYHLAAAPGIDLIWDLTPGQVAGRFELTNGGFDPNIGAVLSKVAPGGGNFSFRIGNDAPTTDPISGVTFPGSSGANQPSAEMMSYSFVVDPNNAGFGFKYATVMDFANHDEAFQPTFAVTIYDDNGDTINCANYLLNPTDGYTQFYSVGDDGDVSGALSGVIFSPWQDVATDLSGYAGQTVTVEFKVKDCHGNSTCSSNDPSCSNFCANCQTGQCESCLQSGSHFAYAYFDTYCTPMNIDMPDFCAGVSQLDICAPIGYASYNWPTGQPGMQAPFDEQCLTINNPVAGDTYTVNMTTINGCNVTRTIVLQEIPSAVTADTAICPGASVDLSINPLGTNGPYTYSWSPGGSTNSSITVSPASTTTYSVTVTNSLGCSSTFDIEVSIASCGVSVIGNDETICDGECANLSVTTVNTTGTVSYSWSPNIGSGAGPFNVCPSSTTDYIVTITDGGAQTAKDTLTVTVNPTYNITQNVNACQNSTFTYPDGTTSTITGDESHTSNFTTSLGCDSIIITNITEDPEYIITNNIDICSTSDYTYADGTTSTNIITNESHVSSFVLPSGCDSIITENLNIVPSITNTLNVNICFGSDYTYSDGSTSTNIIVNESGSNTIITTSGCDSVIIENLIVSPEISSSQSLSICTGSSITVGTSTYNSTGTFTDILVSSGGCDSTVTTNLSVLTDITFAQSIDICPGGSFTVGTNTYNSTGVFTDVLVSSGGCDSTVTTTLTISSPDDATFSFSQSSICINATNPTPVIGGLVGGTFTIDNGGAINSSTGEIDLTASGLGFFTITYTTNGICPNSTTVSITITPEDDATFSYPQTSFCESETNPVAVINGGAGVFSITGGGIVDLSTGEIFIGITGVGTFTVTYTTNGSCSSSSSVNITIDAQDDASFIATQGNENCFGTQFEIESNTNGTSTLAWYVNGVYTTSIPNPIITIPFGLDQNVLLVVQNGACTDSSSSVLSSNTTDPLIVPNVITPNADHINDEFKITSGNVDCAKITIVNRWGQEMFKGAEGESWNGTYKGKPVTEGVYFYILEYGNQVIQGSVTVAR